MEASFKINIVPYIPQMFFQIIPAVSCFEGKYEIIFIIYQNHWLDWTSKG